MLCSNSARLSRRCSSITSSLSLRFPLYRRVDGWSLTRNAPDSYSACVVSRKAPRCSGGISVSAADSDRSQVVCASRYVAAALACEVRHCMYRFGAFELRSIPVSVVAFCARTTGIEHDNTMAAVRHLSLNFVVNRTAAETAVRPVSASKKVRCKASEQALPGATIGCGKRPSADGRTRHQGERLRLNTNDYHWQIGISTYPLCSGRTSRG